MLSRMSPGDEIDVLEGYRATLRDCLATLDPAAVLKLRGELQVLSQWLAVQKKSAVQPTAVRDGLWSLATDFRDLESLASIRAARAAIDDLFVKFDDPGVALATRLALLYQLYALVAVIRCAKLFEDLRGPA